MRIGPDTYLVQTQPGFEGIAWDEIASVTRVDGRPSLRARELGRRNVPDRAGVTIFTTSHPQVLGSLRTSEDLFAVVGYRYGLADDAVVLQRMAAIARDAPYIERSLAVRSHLMPGTRSGRRLRYRVIARMAGEHHFRRVDVARAISRGIAEREDRVWRPSDAQADVEFWVTVIGSELILTIRLSDDRMRHRDYKVAHRPGSLRPSAAAALAHLSRPDSQDSVLDPFCGAGTILIERAHLARHRQLIGCDRDLEALAAARENIGPRYKPLELHRWDAASIPLPDNSVNKIVTNLPWGAAHGSHEQNRRLYPRVFQEFHRLIAPGGRMVILTAETRLMSDLVARGLFRPHEILRVSLLGASAAIYIAEVSR